MSKLQKLINYGVIGAATTLINLIVYYVLVDWQCHYMFANIVAFVISVAFAYVANRKWVFRVGTSFSFRECLYFFASRIVTLLTESVLLLVLISWQGFHPQIVKLGVTVLIVVVNYLMSEQIVFREEITKEI